MKKKLYHNKGEKGQGKHQPQEVNNTKRKQIIKPNVQNIISIIIIP